METDLIDQFFAALDRALQLEAEVIITGASAGALMGHIRPSIDIDFEIRPIHKRDLKKFEMNISAAVHQAVKAVPLAANYGTDINRWNMIELLEYRKTAIEYKRFGRLLTKLIAPMFWTIGKMTRYLEKDIQDVCHIIQTKKIQAPQLIDLWAKALLHSHLSLALEQFKEHVIHFIRNHGKDAWGKSTNLTLLENRFRAKIQKQ